MYVVATHLRYVTQTCDITRQLSNELMHNWIKSYLKTHLESYVPTQKTDSSVRRKAMK